MEMAGHRDNQGRSGAKKHRLAGLTWQKTHDLKVSGHLAFAAANYSDHPLVHLDAGIRNRFRIPADVRFHARS